MIYPTWHSPFYDALQGEITAAEKMVEDSNDGHRAFREAWLNQLRALSHFYDGIGEMPLEPQSESKE